MKSFKFSPVLFLAVSLALATPIFSTDASMRGLSSFSVESARDLAMSGLSILQSDSADTVIVNPALCALANPGISTTYEIDSIMLEEADLSSSLRASVSMLISGGKEFNEWGIGLASKNFYESSIDQYDASDNRDGSFSYYDSALKLVLAKRFNTLFAVGAGVNGYISSVNSDLISAEDKLKLGLSFNFGFWTMLEIPFIPPLTLAVRVDDVPGIFQNYEGESAFFNVDSKATAALGYADMNGAFMAGLSLKYNFNKSKLTPSLGAEIRIVDFNKKDAESTVVSNDAYYDNYEHYDTVNVPGNEQTQAEEKLLAGLYARVGVEGRQPSIGAGLYLWKLRISYAAIIEDFSEMKYSQTFGLTAVF